VNKVEPTPSNCRFNLFAKDDWRSCSADKPEPVGPDVALVIGRLAFAGGTEWLAGATSCPNRSVVVPSGEPEGVGPPSDPGEEMGLRITPEIIAGYVVYTSLIHIPRRNLASSNEIS
jgi:hypothetical protein